MLNIKRALSGFLVFAMILSSLLGINIQAYASPDVPDRMPQNVEYTPVTADSVTINWSAVDGAEGYNIYRRDAKVSTA